jgi:hypothetical protein
MGPADSRPSPTTRKRMPSTASVNLMAVAKNP